MVRKFSLCVCLLLPGVTLPAQDTWIQRAALTIPARTQAVGFSVGQKGYVATGSDGSAAGILSDLQEFDPATNTWRYRATLPSPLRGSVAFSVGSKAYVTTGAETSGFNTRLFVWDQLSDSWTTRLAFPGQGRMAAVGISFGNRGYIATGLDGYERALNDLWEYDPFANSWTKKASLPGNGRCYATALAINNRIYIGLGNNGSACLQDWWEYTPYTDTWRQMADLTGLARTGALGFALNGKGYIVGGVDLNFRPLQDVWEFDPERNTWTQLGQFPGLARGYGISFTIGEYGYIAAGTSVNGYLCECWQCYPARVIKQIPREEVLQSDVVISPNPFFYRFALKMRHPYTGMLEIFIRDPQGRIVFRKNFLKDTHYIVRCWEIDNLPDGLFVFEVHDPSGSVNYKQTIIHKSFGI